MTMRFCVLGSGSSGNCTVLVLGSGERRRVLLIDAGFSPQRTKRLLWPLKLRLDDVHAILVTHFDLDHFHPGWVRLLPRLKLSIHAHRRHRSRPVRAGIGGRHLQLFEDEVHVRGIDASIRGLLLAHDDLGSVGYDIEHDGARLALATDLGRVTGPLLELFDGADALALESNYDPGLQRASGRPAFVQQRITGGLGHLSNDQALEAALRIDRRGGLQQLALLHLSRQCNCPDLVRGLWAERAPHLAGRLTITAQDEPSAMLHVEPTHRGRRSIRVERQLDLFEPARPAAAQPG